MLPEIREFMRTLRTDLGALKAGQDRTAEQLAHLTKEQRAQANEIMSIRGEARRAAEIANEAKRQADDAQREVSTMVTAIQSHVSGVAAVLKGQGERIEAAQELIKSHTATLKDQDRVLAEQSQDLKTLVMAHATQNAREEERALRSKEQSEFFKWALPVATGFVTTAVTVAVWIATHVQH